MSDSRIGCQTGLFTGIGPVLPDIGVVAWGRWIVESSPDKMGVGLNVPATGFEARAHSSSVSKQPSLRQPLEGGRHHAQFPR
jgi:hypothetical protein